MQLVQHERFRVVLLVVGLDGLLDHRYSLLREVVAHLVAFGVCGLEVCGGLEPADLWRLGAPVLRRAGLAPRQASSVQREDSSRP